MTEEEFKEFAERIVSEDETRQSLRNAFRWKYHSIATDGRIALVCNEAFESLPNAGDYQGSIGHRLCEEILPTQLEDEYVRFDLDSDLLGMAAAAAAQDIAPEMEELRHYVPDPDDPDDIESWDSERFVLTRHTAVIMPDPRRSVIAGYYADVIAGLCEGRTVCACASRKTGNKTLFVKGDDWELAIMPMLIDGRKGDAASMAMYGHAIADAKTGELVWRRSNEGPCPIDTLRSPQKEGETEGWTSGQETYSTRAVAS